MYTLSAQVYQKKNGGQAGSGQVGSAKRELGSETHLIRPRTNEVLGAHRDRPDTIQVPRELLQRRVRDRGEEVHAAAIGEVRC